MISGSNAGQCLNPVFVHSIKVPDNLVKICVVARDDGVIDVINMESELGLKVPQNPEKESSQCQKAVFQLMEELP